MYLGSQYNQFNATNVDVLVPQHLRLQVRAARPSRPGRSPGSACRTSRCLRNPAPNTKVFLPGYTLTFNRQTVSGGIRTVTAIYVQSFLQNLSVGVSRC